MDACLWAYYLSYIILAMYQMLLELFYIQNGWLLVSVLITLLLLLLANVIFLRSAFEEES